MENTNDPVGGRMKRQGKTLTHLNTQPLLTRNQRNIYDKIGMVKRPICGNKDFVHPHYGSLCEILEFCIEKIRKIIDKIRKAKEPIDGNKDFVSPYYGLLCEQIDFFVTHKTIIPRKNDFHKDFVNCPLLWLKISDIFVPYETYSHDTVSLQASSDDDSFVSTRTVIYSPRLEEECFPNIWEAEAIEAQKRAFRTPSPAKTAAPKTRAPEPTKSRGGAGGGRNVPTRGGGAGASSSRGGAGAGQPRGGGAAGGNSGGNKRNNDGDNRKPKKTFAEMTKDLKVIEVRASDPKYPLKQDDFDCLEFTMLHKYLDMDEPGFVYSTPRPGLSQGAVWYGCANEGTYNFIKDTAPEVDPPEEKPYRYIIAAGNKRYIKIRCAKKFWMTRERFLKALFWQNPSLAKVIDDDGQVKDAHMVITSGLEDENKEKAIADGFFMIGIEIEDVSIDAFVKKRGEIMIGNSTLRVTGAGIDARIEEADRIEADRVRAEDSAAHGGPQFNW